VGHGGGEGWAPGGLRFHDLRHTGNTWAAESGANLRELMERMGHSSTKAALIYLHAASDGHRRTRTGIDRKLRSGATDLGDGPDDNDGAAGAGGPNLRYGMRVARTPGLRIFAAPDGVSGMRSDQGSIRRRAGEENRTPVLSLGS